MATTDKTTTKKSAAKDTAADGQRRAPRQTSKAPGKGQQTMAQTEKAIPTSTDNERRARSSTAGDALQPSGAGKVTPSSELPGGPNIDLGAVSSGEIESGEVTGGDTRATKAGLSDPVPLATRQADGAPQPPQPTGADTAEGPIGQVSKPGTLAAVSTATNDANAERMQTEDGGKERAEAASQKNKTSDLPEDNGAKPTMELSAPIAENTMLTITGRNFPPRERVTVELSHSQTPSGVTLLRSDLDGTVQVSVFPAPGEQSATFRSDTAEATINFRVAAAPSSDPEGEEERGRERTRLAEKRAERQ